ncbi:MAG: hypothetical protein V3T88_03490 [Nitrosomonadaceae bacterium]
MAEAQAPGDSNAPKVLLGVTPNDKEIFLVRKPNCSVRKIEFGKGGQLPKMLEGGYSSVAAATHVVESYLAKIAAKEIKVDGTKYAAKAAK